MITDLSKIEELAEKLKKDYQLSNYESLKLAIEIQRNKIISKALGADNAIPSLEAIAIELGAGENYDTLKSILLRLIEKD